jgi:hypothetical protein
MFHPGGMAATSRGSCRPCAVRHHPSERFTSVVSPEELVLGLLCLGPISPANLDRGSTHSRPNSHGFLRPGGSASTRVRLTGESPSSAMCSSCLVREINPIATGSPRGSKRFGKRCSFSYAPMPSFRYARSRLRPKPQPLAELAARKGRPCQGRTAPTGDYRALTFFLAHTQLVNRADRDSSGTEVGCFARLSDARPAAIRSTAGALVVRLCGCVRPARRTTYRSCGGDIRPGPRRGTSGRSSCRLTRRSSSSLPRASSGSTPDAQSVTKRAKSN